MPSRQEFEGKLSQTSYGMVEVLRKIADKIERNLDDGVPGPEAIEPALDLLNRWYEKKRARNKASDILDEMDDLFNEDDLDPKGGE